jgi:hypothetical protein
VAAYLDLRRELGQPVDVNLFAGALDYSKFSLLLLLNPEHLQVYTQLSMQARQAMFQIGEPPTACLSWKIGAVDQGERRMRPLRGFVIVTLSVLVKLGQFDVRVDLSAVRSLAPQCDRCR